MRKILFAVAVGLTLGCGEDPAGPPVSDRYALVRLNGLPLPYVRVQTGTSKEEVVKGEILLYANGSYVDRTTERSTQGSISQSFDATLRGPYSWDGSTITFTVISEEDQSGDDKYYGTLALDTLTIQYGNTSWKYVER